MKFYPCRHAIACQQGQFLLLILFCVFCSTFYILINRWRADYYFAKGEKFYKTSYVLPALTNLEKAVLLNPKEALYHAYLAKTSAKLAAVYSQTEASESAKISSQLADLAESEINRALTLNSAHLNFYKNRAEIYIFLSVLDPSLKQKAVDTLVYASKLAPTDAKILYNLSLLYEQEEEIEKAIKTLEKGIDLKPNYTKAYIQLAKFYQENNQLEKAKEKLQFILKNIDPDSKQALQVLEKLN